MRPEAMGLPSEEMVAAPPLPRPPSYLKSKTRECLPGASLSLAVME